jgi:hypothetical protein
VFITTKTTIEVASSDVGDATNSMKTCGQKHVNVALMACVLETCDLEICLDAHDRLEWETTITKECCF